MKKTFDFMYDDGKYILKNTSPNEKNEPFVIECETLEFNCEKFYLYVFSDITQKFNIIINNKIEGNPDVNIDKKKANRIYDYINKICTEVIGQMNKLYDNN